MQKITYKSSGVDVSLGNVFVKKIRGIAQKTSTPEVLAPIGSFGGLYDISALGLKNPVFVSSADGVGTKVKIAIAMGKYDTVGIDAVAMNVNDILTLGARPLFFLDYLGTGKLKVEQSVRIVKGVAKGCGIAGCSLIGGETAEMPDIYAKDDFDLAGFCVGVIEKGQIIDGRTITEGDMVIGLRSSGFHSNGYSLVRRVVKEKRLDLFKKYKGFTRRLGDILLEPTKIYVKEVLELAGKISIKGMAHITGGSFGEKLSRVIPDGLCATINRNSWRLPDIFRFIMEAGGISDSEMYSTFNCGIGYVIVLSPEDGPTVMQTLQDEAVQIGFIEKSSGEKVNII